MTFGGVSALALPMSPSDISMATSIFFIGSCLLSIKSEAVSLEEKS